MTVLHLVLVFASCGRPPTRSRAFFDTQETYIADYVYFTTTPSGTRVIDDRTFTRMLKDPNEASTPLGIIEIAWVRSTNLFNRFSPFIPSSTTRTVRSTSVRLGLPGTYDPVSSNDASKHMKSAAFQLRRPVLGAAVPGMVLPEFTILGLVYVFVVQLFVIRVSIAMGRGLSVWSLERAVARAKARDPSVCHHCGYDCTGIGASRCPRCGSERGTTEPGPA